MIQLNPDRGTLPAYSSLGAESARLFTALAAELLERTGIDIGYRRASLLHVTLDEAEEAQLRAHRAWQLDQGMSVGWLDGAAAVDVEPALNPTCGRPCSIRTITKSCHVSLPKHWRAPRPIWAR